LLQLLNHVADLALRIKIFLALFATLRETLPEKCSETAPNWPILRHFLTNMSIYFCIGNLPENARFGAVKSELASIQCDSAILE